MRPNKKGFGILEVVVAAAILAATLLAAISFQKQNYVSTMRLGQKEKLGELLALRVSYIRLRIEQLGGPLQICRLYGVAVSDVGTFNPVLSRNLNTSFSTIFPSLTNPEAFVSGKDALTLTYRIALISKTFQGIGFVTSELAYPNLSVSLNQVSTFLIEVKAISDAGVQVGERSVIFAL